MNPNAYELAFAREAAPRNRSERRFAEQNRARTERTGRRQMARLQRALNQYLKESAS